MSADTPPTDAHGPTVDVADEDAQQTLLRIETPGVEIVAAVNHHAQPEAVQKGLDEIRKEVEQLAHLNRWHSFYHRGEDE